MHAFSRSLIDLYDLAGQARFDEFPSQALNLLKQWIKFDGAVLGVGESTMDLQTELQITQAHVQDRDASILEAYGRISASDPVTYAFMKGLPSPMAVDAHVLYRGQDIAELDSFSHDFKLRHLMLFGDQPADGDSGRWLVLYRSDNRAFSAVDAEYLHAAWFHISRAIGVNRSTFLDSQNHDHAVQASALINGHGGIEVSDRDFIALLQREWPGFQAKKIPAELQGCLATGNSYRGRHIEANVRRQNGFIICTLVAADSIENLTPGENAVARRFATGLSAKQIARELGVSPHTVRSQISSVYAKLEVHDKAALAQRIMGQAGTAQ